MRDNKPFQVGIDERIKNTFNFIGSKNSFIKPDYSNETEIAFILLHDEAGDGKQQKILFGIRVLKNKMPANFFLPILIFNLQLKKDLHFKFV